MIRLSDEQMHVISRTAEPLFPSDRGAYFHRVAELLHGHPVLGDGLIARVAKQAQHEFLRPPDLSRARGTSKYR
jgi:hypothetical protein